MIAHPPTTRTRLAAAVALCLMEVAGAYVLNAAEPTAPSEPGGLLPPLTAEGKRDLEKLTRDLTPTPSKPKIIILDAAVTIDGQSRGDLGSFFSDTLSARMLASKTCDVIDASALGNTAPSALEVSQRPLDPQGNPTSAPGGAMALDLGKAGGADFVCVPTIISLAGEIRLTMRKLRIPSGKVESIIQDTAKGDVRQIGALAERTALKLAPIPEPDIPATPRFDHIQVWMSPKPAVDPLTQAILSAPKALRANSPMAAARSWPGGIEPVKIGEISVVDTSWSFCELSCAPGTVKLNERIFAWGGTPQDRLINLSVSRIDGQRVIAEFDSMQPVSKLLRTGLGVYNTRPPAPK